MIRARVWEVPRLSRPFVFGAGVSLFRLRASRARRRRACLIEPMDRDALVKVIKKRGPSRSGYWQGWIDAFCSQNAIPPAELLELEADVLAGVWGRPS